MYVLAVCVGVVYAAMLLVELAQKIGFISDYVVVAERKVSK